MILRRLVLSTMLLLSACNILPQVPTVTPTRNFSAPTLAPSPTTFIRDSEQLYLGTDTAGQNNATAAALPNSVALPPLAIGTQGPGTITLVTLFLEDGTSLTGDMYASTTGLRVPTALILANNRADYQALASQLTQAGLSALVLDVPQSLLATDLDSLLTSLSEDSMVDPGRMAVIGAQNFADTALLGCAVYLICDAVVLLSPQSRDTLLNVIPTYNPRPLFIAVALNDPVSFPTSSALSAVFAENSVFAQQASGQGVGLMTLNGQLAGEIVAWLRRVFQMP